MWRGQFGRLRQAGDQRHIRRLDPAIGEIEAGRRLRAARHAHQDHVRFRQTRLCLAVVMRQHVVHRIDATEIVSVQNILLARPCRPPLTNILLQQTHHRLQHVDHRHREPLTGRLQLGIQRPIDQGGQHGTRLGLDPADHPV